MLNGVWKHALRIQCGLVSLLLLLFISGEYTPLCQKPQEEIKLWSCSWVLAHLLAACTLDHSWAESDAPRGSTTWDVSIAGKVWRATGTACIDHSGSAHHCEHAHWAAQWLCGLVPLQLRPLQHLLPRTGSSHLLFQGEIMCNNLNCL